MFTIEQAKEALVKGNDMEARFYMQNEIEQVFTDSENGQIGIGEFQDRIEKIINLFK